MNEKKESQQPEARGVVDEAMVETWKALHASEVQVRQRWQARAERLAGALLELCNVIDGHDVPVAVEGKAAHARAALNPTAAQENDDA